MVNTTVTTMPGDTAGVTLVILVRTFVTKIIADGVKRPHLWNFMKYFFVLLFPILAFAQAAPYGDVLNRLQLDLKINEGSEKVLGKDCYVKFQSEVDELTITVAQGDWGNRFASMTLPASGMTRAFGDKVSEVVYISSATEKVLTYLYTRNSAGKESSQIELKVSIQKNTIYSLKINDRLVICTLKN